MFTRRASVALALATALVACRGDTRGSGSAGEAGGTVVLSTAAEPDFLLPPIITNVQGKMITDLVFDKLAEVGTDMNVFNDASYRPRHRAGD